MADINNFTEIAENFDTIKTLLNSIRAQGILNTSDVDKLLMGINSKLEKLNTEEDIDLIKIFLSELKQNLDERHSVLLSKFGAIESLFSNLLKNSSEALKSSEVKELFDIVATNLSVFSREVVSHKEILSDITLRLDAMRSDDSQKKEIIKNISFLKSDLERLTNGFDSIVLSLNENFKTVIKSISSIDPSSVINNFGKELEDIVNSSNTILSAIQMLDKKSVQIEEELKNLATKDDLLSAKKWIGDLASQEQLLSQSVDNLADKYYKIDNLAEKIDASVEIIAGLKTIIADKNEQGAAAVIDRLNQLEDLVKTVSSEKEFDDFKRTLEATLDNIYNVSVTLQASLKESNEELLRINGAISALDINVSFKSLAADLLKTEQGIKEHVNIETDKIIQLVDVSATRTLNELNNNAESLAEKLSDTQTLLSGLCEKSFSELEDNIADIKNLVSQIDENNVSANNAIFSNITDRLTLFEGSLKNSLAKQENSVSNSSNQLLEQINNIKDLSGILDYKMDSSVVEFNNAKLEFVNLRKSVDAILALDFVDKVSELKVDLYAGKQDLVNLFESSNAEFSEKFSNDLFSKYELLISKIDIVEENIKQAQAESLTTIKNLLDNISSSIVDVLSYVSSTKEVSTEAIEIKLDNIEKALNDNNLSYIENVKDIIDIVRVQIENNIKSLQEDSNNQIKSIGSVLNSSTEFIRDDIKISYNKLLEVQKKFDEIKETLSLNNTSLTDDISDLLEATSVLRSDFDGKLTSLKSAILDKVSDFQKEFTCENADKISEIKFASETLYSKQLATSQEMKEELRGEISRIAGSLKLNMEQLTEQILGTSAKIDSVNFDMINVVKHDFSSQLEGTATNVNQSLQSFTHAMGERLDETVSKIAELDDSVCNLSTSTTASLSSTLAKVLENFVSLKALIANFNDKTSDEIQKSVEVLLSDFERLKNKVDSVDSSIDEDLTRQLSIIETNFESLNQTLADFFEQTTQELGSSINTGLLNVSESLGDALSRGLEQYKTKLDFIFDSISKENNNHIQLMEDKLKILNDAIQTELVEQNVKSAEILTNITEKLKNVLIENIEMSSADYKSLKTNLDNFAKYMEDQNSKVAENLKSKLGDIAKLLDSGLTVQVQEIGKKFSELTLEVSEIAGSTAGLNNEITSKVSEISEELNSLKITLSDVVVSNSEEYQNKLDEVSTKLFSECNKLSSTILNVTSETENSINKNLLKEVNKFSEVINVGLLELKDLLDSVAENSQSNLVSQVSGILSEIKNLDSTIAERTSQIRNTLSDNISDEIKTLLEKVNSLFEEQNLNIVAQFNTINSKYFEDLNVKTLELMDSFEKLNDRLDKDEISRMNIFQTQLSELSSSFKSLVEETKVVTKSEISSISEIFEKSNKDFVEDLEQSIEDKINAVLVSNADIAADELQTMDAYANKIMEQVRASQETSISCKEFITDFVKKELEQISNNIEKESDILVKDLLEQMSTLRDFQRDELLKLTGQLEDIIEDKIYANVSELKSYLDVKCDTSVLNGKLDSINSELNRTTENILSASNKLLTSSVFDEALADMKVANNALITTMAESLNSQIQSFIKNDLIVDIDEKFNLFDKKFVDTVVDKYEEIKLISSRYNNAFESIEASVNVLLSKFTESKTEIYKTLLSSLDDISSEIDELSLSFADLKAQITNKSLDDAFQTSMNSRISGIEQLVKEQFGYIEDISELCCSNLPELTEMNALVKYNIVQALADLSAKLDNQDIAVEKEITALKTDVITQFLNVFNQISFVAEQEEILDFIQEKHSELISILSHMVTTIEDVETVKDNVAVIDNKVDTLKDDIDLINEKISAIISSDGDVDYVYSLQDLESDIANLRLALNELKENNKSKELEELISSTNNVYSLVDSLKSELPRFDSEEFKKDFVALNEDIVSISTRTNKLILASDESYKTLQENLQDFKLVINDLDERTRNFAHEAGIDRIDNKLGVINSMIQNGAKTNQVFNQVFEYLAEWVDNAGAQITAISDKVESLDEIGQIKVMLEDLKAEAEDDSDSAELIEALSNVFDKQAKKITSLEAKLDRVIVETTISNKNNKLDLTPLEETLNRFLVAIDDKMISQQTKIDSLESKLEDVMSMINPKDTAQLTKKVGGMDRQIAKLNKSIEKIASHVVEK